jgi:phosphatidylglycerol:prolipoprotein diacylglycerol transferase
MFPKLFQYGDFFLPTYGVLVALAFLVGLWVTTKLAKRVGMNQDLIINLVVYCALAGLIGAKLLMFAFDWDHFSKNPADMFSLSTLRAAGVYQGGLVLAILVAFWYVRKHGLPWLKTFDVFAPGIALGHAIGRLGCFSAGCCWGKETDLPWAVTFRNPAANELTGVPLRVPLHPSQLYELASEAILFGFLYWRFGKPHKPGTIIGLYLVISSVMRFLIEFTRFHEHWRSPGPGFSGNQAGPSIPLIAPARFRPWRTEAAVRSDLTKPDSEPRAGNGLPPFPNSAKVALFCSRYL